MNEYARKKKVLISESRSFSVRYKRTYALKNNNIASLREILNLFFMGVM